MQNNITQTQILKEIIAAKTHTLTKIDDEVERTKKEIEEITKEVIKALKVINKKIVENFRICTETSLEDWCFAFMFARGFRFIVDELLFILLHIKTSSENLVRLQNKAKWNIWKYSGDFKEQLVKIKSELGLTNTK